MVKLNQAREWRVLKMKKFRTKSEKEWELMKLFFKRKIRKDDKAIKEQFKKEKKNV